MAGDPYWYYKVLGLHCDGTNGSTTFTDVKGKTVTANGNAQISTAQYPALTGKTASAYFDGSGDYLTVPDSADWSFGSGDFTLRMRCYFTGYSANYSGNYALGLISQDSAGSRSFFFYVNGTASSLTGLAFYGFYDPGSTFFGLNLGSYAFSLNTWYDIEFCRSGNTAYAFVDGQMTNPGGSSFSQSLRDSTAPLTIGWSGYDGAFPFIGYMSEVEIYKGVALHTANFTPSSAPFKDEYVAVSGTTKDSSNAFASRLVRVYRRDTGALVGSVISNATTGVYKVIAQNSGTTTPLKHFVLCFDATADPPGSPTENALIYDNITPA